MNQITKDDPKSQTENIVSDNIEKLKQIFPEIVTEGKIDFETLESLLGDYVEKDDERYSFNWKGKANARRIAQTPSTATLRPVKEESKNWDKTENLYIEGDNLEVLKLLQKSYYKKVKMIYIDPPYNTGKDFVYKDDFKDNLKNYLELTGQVNQEGKKVSTNSDTSGRYHSNWLNMMYPRLKLARNLLDENGVIFISIDENEMHNLRKICDEIFGEENFIGELVIKSNPRGSQEEFGISKQHEYIVVYSKTLEGYYSIIGSRRKDVDSEFNYLTDNNQSARLLGLRKRGGDWRRSDRPNMYFPLYVDPNTMKVSIIEDDKYKVPVFPKRPTGEESRWTWGKDTAKTQINELIAKKINRGDKVEFDIYRIDLLFDSNGAVKRTKFQSIVDDKEMNYQNGRSYLKTLFNNSEVFDFPKPVELIKKLLSNTASDKSYILDFFSGSSTTAHSVMQLNAEDGGKRKFIVVQIPETTPEGSEAFKAGFESICELGKERIRRAGDKIVQELKEKLKGQNQLFKSNEIVIDPDTLDIGFKVFKLDTSNIKTWDATEDNLEKSLLDSVSNIKSERKEEDVLYEVLLKYGLDLTLPIEEIKFDGKIIYSIGFGALIVCLANNIDISVAEKIIQMKEQIKPESMNVIFRDNGFKDDVVKTNMIQLLTKHGVESVRSI